MSTIPHFADLLQHLLVLLETPFCATMGETTCLIQMRIEMQGGDQERETMFHKTKSSPEVQPKPERRRFKAAYKRQIVADAARCQHGELGWLLRREGLTYTQLSNWRNAQAPHPA